MGGITINMPTSMYAYEAPDALDLPWMPRPPHGSFLSVVRDVARVGRILRREVP